MLIFRKIISYKFILLILAGISLFACKSSYTLLTIEKPKSAPEELPANIQSITLMNRSMNNQFENYRKDSLQMYFFRKGYQLTKIILDSMASDTTIRALADLMFESGRYDVVVPVERNLPRYLTYEILPDTLNPDLVQKYCTAYKTDALMVLERFSTKVMADYSSEKYLNSTTGFNYTYYASLDIKYDASFRIYKPGNPMWVKEISLTDTISWESSEYSLDGLFNRLPSTKQALIEAGIKVALDVDEKLSPTWTPEKRGYFLITPKNDRGQQLMNENKQDEAADYWTEMAKSEDKKIRSKAEYNLALISELNDDIDQAISWGVKSFYSYYRHQTEAYLKKLRAKKETP
jgi:hypothetical protein